jgi:poly-gamma-glutamate capsule biosynthesis protein CapA/YwtB (metallophosphatase superfamily)
VQNNISQVLPEARDNVKRAAKAIDCHTKDMVDLAQTRAKAIALSQMDRLTKTNQQLKAIAMTISVANTNLDCAQVDLAAQEVNLVKVQALMDSKLYAAKALEEEVQFSMSKVGLFPEHVFHKLPSPPQGTPSPVVDNSSTRACP